MTGCSNSWNHLGSGLHTTIIWQHYRKFRKETRLVRNRVDVILRGVIITLKVKNMCRNNELNVLLATSEGRRYAAARKGRHVPIFHTVAMHTNVKNSRNPFG